MKRRASASHARSLARGSRPPAARACRSAHTAARAEAEKWLETAVGSGPVPPLLIAVGLASGDLLDVLDERAPGTRVLALEPDPAAAGAFLARRDRNGWRERGRLVYLVGPDYAGADQAWRLFPAAPDAHALLLHPDAARSPAAASGALQAVKRIVFGVKANAEARRRFAPRYLANVLRNVPAIARGRDVSALTGGYRGLPAVIAAAGPSLDDAIDDLRLVGDRALTIAADTALRPLLHAGLAPHLVVGADPGAANARHFLELPDCPDTWLVAESALDPGAAAVFDGRTFWFRLARHHPWPWLIERGIDIGLVEMWGSVLTAAFQVACLAGCDPIVIVGADLAFTGGRPYCRGTTYEFDWARATARGRTLEAVWSAQVSRRQTCTAPDLRGRDTITTTSMLSFRDWMLAAAARSGRKVINASGAGILCGGSIEQGSLRNALSETHTIPSPGAVAGTHASSSEPRRDITSRLRSTLDAMRAGNGVSAPVSDWAAFAGDGFDTDAIRGALEEAIDGGRSRGAPAVWASLPPSPLAARLVMRLPEAIAPAGSAIANAPDSPQLDEPRGRGERTDVRPEFDKSAALAEAFGLLRRIGDEVRHLGGVALTMKPSQAGRVAVSALYAWPDVIRWHVMLFEALLQHASPGIAATRAGRLHLREAAATPGAPPLESSDRTNGAHACALLALAWLRTACVLPNVTEAVHIAVVQSIAASASHTPGGTGETYAAATLDFRLHASGAAGDIDFSTPVADAAFARLLTGALDRGVTADEPRDLLSAITDGVRVSIALRTTPPDGSPPAAIVRRSRERVAPRRLSTPGTHGSIVAYSTDEGAVCVPFQGHESVLVRADGSISTHLRWPRPIVNELPFGENGAVAWGDGLDRFPHDVRPGYVMFRRHHDDEVEILDLPARPTIGRWWRGRLYWNCHPRRVESPTGLISWTPGDEAPRPELPDLPATIGMHSAQDGLTFELGGGPLPGGGWQRRFSRDGWTWRPGEKLQPIRLRAHGAASARVVSGAGTATAYPEADLVLIEPAGGRMLSMTCYYPLGLAWLGDSLLVGTLDRELLLFERLSSHMD